jgi:hypothetical protein
MPALHVVAGVGILLAAVVLVVRRTREKRKILMPVYDRIPNDDEGGAYGVYGSM